jgi:tetratricopeptide (TPR) repeat protein
MRDGLANAWWSQVRDRAEDDRERLSAAGNLALSLKHQGKHDEAEKMQREVLAVMQRVLGAEHPSTLTTADNLAACLLHQGKHDEAEKMHREVLAVKKRVLGAQGSLKHAPMEPTAPSVGARVKLHSLQKNPEHNGVEGEVVEPLHPVSGRWGVKIDSDGRVLALKPANLVLIRKHAQMVPAS